MASDRQLHDYMEQVFMLGCSRCGYEGVSWYGDIGEAESDLRHRGWVVEGTLVICPRCNRDS